MIVYSLVGFRGEKLFVYLATAAKSEGVFLIFSGSCRHYRRDAHGWGPVKQGGLCVHVSLQTVILAAPFSFELSFALRVLHCSLCLFGIHFLIFLD